MRSHLALVVLVGCGGGGSSSEPVVLHAARTKLAAVQDGDTWKPLALDPAGDAKLSLDGPTLIVTVCDDTDFFNYYTVGVGPGADDVEMYCGETKPAAHVTITAPPTTNVYVGLGRAAGGETAVVGQGTYDVVAIDTSMSPARAEIRRGIAVTGDMTLTFDLAATGMPMVKPSIEVTGAALGETPTVQVGLTLATTTASRTIAYWIATTGAWILPPALLRPDDEHRVYASTSTQNTQRSASRDVNGTETSFSLALPPYITTATPTFGTMPTLTWQGDARLDGVYFGINNPDFSRLWDINLFPSWAEAGGQTSTVTLPDPHTLPGWSAAWDLTNVTGFDWYMLAYQDAKPDHLAVSRSGMF